MNTRFLLLGRERETIGRNEEGISKNKGRNTFIRTESKIKENDYTVLHFLTRLVELYKNQKDKEQDVREFVAVCNL